MKLKNILFLILACTLTVPATTAYAKPIEYAYSHYKKGMDYFNKKDYKHAITEFQYAVNLEPNASYLRKLAESYKLDGQYQKASETHYKEANVYYKMGDMNTYYAVIRIAESLNSSVDLYMTTDKQPKNYQLQKYEPSNGMYIGAFIEKEENLNYSNRFAEFNQKTGKQHAVYFAYHNYGVTFPTAWLNKVKEANANNAVHLALEPNNGLEAVKDDQYLRQFARDAYAAKVPIFIRFASEMNGNWVKWNGNPKLYIEKFRLISKVMKEEAPNVAMVWSPADSPKNEIDKYYPGDDYVDWVGVNHYSNNFQNANINSPNDYTNPIEEIRYVYEKYSDRKPMMLSEYGASHLSAADLKDASNFAITKMHMLYEGAKLNFPRLKEINWFSMNTLKHANSADRKKADYSIMDNKKVFESYKDMISDDYFLPSVVNGEFAKQETSVPTYVTNYKKQAITEPIKIMAWAKTFVPYIGKVTYQINGKVKGESYQYPYDISVKPEDLREGKNEFKITLYTPDNKVAFEKNDALYKSNIKEEQVKVFIGSKDVYTKKQLAELLSPPYIKNGRTMVPIRMISEQLGMNVLWNQKDKTVTLKNGDTNVILTLDKGYASINSKNVKIDAPPELKQNTTFVPLRFISENMGLNVTYTVSDHSVLVKKN
ncbi:stalk domain-containing protein [Bacillus cereus]